MKMSIQTTVEMTDENFKDVLALARQAGFDFDNKPPRVIVKRYLTDQVHQAVIYAHERIANEGD